ncbi:MAG: transglutaminase domain-containing protein [Anaerolineae bacterium]|nr:transglutaminase domain-containing protein [Anaerolineae bacterium]
MLRENSASGWLVRLAKILGPKGLLMWALLVITLICVVSGLADVIRGLDLWYGLLIMATATTVGWVLAAFPVRGWVSGLMGVFLGFEVVLFRVGRLEGKIAEIYGGVLSMLSQMALWLWDWIAALVHWVSTREPIAVTRGVDWGLLPRIYTELWHDLWVLLSRGANWLYALTKGAGVYDPVATALAWGLVIWGCAWWAGWRVNRRHDPLGAVLPGGLLVSFILAYAWASSIVLLPMMGFTFLLMALDRHRAREIHWNRIGTDFSRDLWSDLVTAATAVSLGLILVAAVSPAISVERIQDLVEWIEELTQPEEDRPSVASSLGIEQKPRPAEPTPIERAAVTTLPRKHLIDSGPELSRKLVMVIRTGEMPAMSNILPVEDLNVPRHYWRSLTYDYYYSQGWATSSTSVTEYEAGELTADPDVPFSKVLRQEVTMIGPSDGTVHVDGTLLSINQPFQVHWRSPSGIFAATTEGDTYIADSLTAAVTDVDLRAAGTGIPEWIQQRYLQLPDDLPDRVRGLALSLTATEPTAYDRAKSIEHYLRQFTYTLHVPMPSVNDDIADYFLFDLQMGYCDYYATSMVVLARAAGLPARMVIGYASGTYDVANARYVVTEADAHAWPEIYFPDIGWVEFEPTGGYPEIVRSTGNLPDVGLGEFDRTPLGEMQPKAPPYQTLGWWLLVGLGVTLAAVLVYTLLDSAFLLLWGTPNGTATRLYHRLRRYQEALRAHAYDGQTPCEVADALVFRLNEIAARRDLAQEMLPDAEGEVRELVDLYICAWYSPQPLTSQDRQVAVVRWWVLRWRLWLARWLRSPRRERPPMPVTELSGS